MSSKLQSISALRTLLDEKKASAVELAQEALRNAAQQSSLNAFVDIRDDLTLQQAKAADARLASGENGALLGIPAAHKDIFVTKGWTSTAGSKMLAGYQSPFDAEVVSRLNAAGTVSIGKLNCDEFAMGSSNEKSAYGPCLNPWDTLAVPGGSSGGSAVAVAAGVVISFHARCRAHDQHRMADVGIFYPVAHVGNLLEPAGHLPDMRPEVIELCLVELFVEIALDRDAFRVIDRKGHVAQGAIGKVVNTVGLGPHAIRNNQRPDWFFDRQRYGGILCDIGSHQFEQFLFFSGAMEAEIVSATVANRNNPSRPGLQDVGDVHMRTDSTSGYVRVDWFTPEGLPTWGDGRLTILGTEQMGRQFDMGQTQADFFERRAHTGCGS